MNTTDLMEFNEGYLKSLAAQRARQNKDRNRTVTCPHPVMNYSLTDGTLKTEKVECGLGPGPWCTRCGHYKRHLYQQRFGKQAYIAKREHLAKKQTETGIAAHLWNEKGIGAKI